MLIQQDTSRFVKYIATLEDWNISIEYKTMMIDEYWYPIKRHHVNVLELIYQKDYFLIYVSHIKKRLNFNNIGTRMLNWYSVLWGK